MAMQELLYFDDNLRGPAVEKATDWTAQQAARLGVTPSDILAAVTRGWLPDLIAGLAVAEVDKLASVPFRLQTYEVRPLIPEFGSVAGRRRDNVTATRSRERAA